MRKNYIALGMVFLLCWFIIAVAVSPTQGAYIRSGITGHSWLITTSQSTEITVSEAELLSHADLYDFQKGLHSTMSRSEGTLVNLNSIIRNDNDVQYTIEAASLIRYKIGNGSWVEYDRWTTTGVLNAHESVSGSTTPTDLTRLGFWDTGNQIHLGVAVRAYPTADPSDYIDKAWALWLQISDTTTSTPPADETNGDESSGDSTTEEQTDHSYDGLLAVLDPLTPIFGSRLGVVFVILISVFIVIAVLSIVMTDKEKW